MRRRAFIAGLASAATLPIAGHSQQPAAPVIGYLSLRSPEDTAHLLAAFRQGLSDYDYVEGRNVTIEYRWARGQSDRLPAMAAELARRPVSIIATTGGELPALAAKAATSTIPIVFNIGRDPVGLGLVASYNRPGRNVTGVNLLTTTLEAKRLALLHDMVPKATSIGLLVHANHPPHENQIREAEEAARKLSLQVHVLKANTDREIEAAFEAIARQQLAGLAVASAPFFDTRREKIIGLAARYAVPAIYLFREYAVSGGLISYGIDVTAAYRQVGVYAGRILKGANPADLPVIQPTKFELILNLKTAKGLGLVVPNSMQLLADEVIE